MKIYIDKKMPKSEFGKNALLHKISINTFLETIKRIDKDLYNKKLEEVKDPNFKTGLNIILKEENYNYQDKRVDITPFFVATLEIPNNKLTGIGEKSYIDDLEKIVNAETIKKDFKMLINCQDAININPDNIFNYNDNIDVIYLTEDGKTFKVIVREGKELYNKKFFNKTKCEYLSKEELIIQFESEEEALKNFKRLQEIDIKNENMYELEKIKTFSEQLDLRNEMIDYISALLNGENINLNNKNIIKEIIDNLYKKDLKPEQSRTLDKIHKKLNKFKDKTLDK